MEKASKQWISHFSDSAILEPSSPQPESKCLIKQLDRGIRKSIEKPRLPLFTQVAKIFQEHTKLHSQINLIPQSLSTFLKKNYITPPSKNRRQLILIRGERIAAPIKNMKTRCQYFPSASRRYFHVARAGFIKSRGQLGRV